MAKLVIVRHGQSQANRDNIFTGWTDVPLTEKGIEQGQMVGDELARMGIQFDDAHTSYMSRAIKTMNIILERIDQLYIPVYKTWRLNERHYGALSGLNKAKVKEEVGAEQLHRWRRGYSEVPPKLKHWEDQIAPRLMDGKNQLIVAHGSSLRALIKYLDQIPDDQIDQVEVPNGKPILYEFDTALNITKKTFITMDGEENGNS